MNRKTELAKNTLIISLGKIATQFVSFILLPLYTALLTPAEYGIADLFTTCIQLLLPLATLMIEQSVFRYLLEHQDDAESQKRVISSSFILVLVMAAICSVLFFVVAQWIHNAYKYYVLAMLIASALSGWALQIARGLKQTGVYAKGSFLTTLIMVVLNILLIVVLRVGVIGLFWATIISNLVCFVYVAWRMRIAQFFQWASYDKASLRSMLAYSLPLIPNQLSLWIINSSDRWIVNAFMGTGANGILAVSHKFPSIFSTVYSMFQLSWHEMGAVHFHDDDRDAFFSDIFSQAYRLFSALCAIMVAVIPFAFPLLVSLDFREAYNTIPIYMIAVLCNIVVGLLGVVYVALKKTVEIAKTTMFSGILNAVVHLLMIKRFGLYAAAVSTLVSYFVILIYRMIDTKKYLRIQYDYRIYAVSLLVILGISAAYYTQHTGLRVASVVVALAYAVWANIKLVRAGLTYGMTWIRKKRERKM